MNIDRVDNGVIWTAFKAGARIAVMNGLALLLLVVGLKYYFVPEFRADAQKALDRQIHIETWPINSTERNKGRIIKSVSFNNELESLIRWTGAMPLSDREVILNKTGEVRNGTNQKD